MAAKPVKDARAYVHDMLESARHATAYLEGTTLARFKRDGKTQDAVALRLAMIDDLSRELDRVSRAKLSVGPVRLARRIRRRITGADGFVDFAVAWKIVKTELPPLIAALEQYLLLAGR